MVDPEGTREEIPLEEALGRHRDRFLETFGDRPGGAGPARTLRTFFSPGRVNLMGAHLDYNGGPVMPMAIDRGTFLCVRGRDDRRVRMASSLEEGALETSLDELPSVAAGTWFDYPLGTLRRLLARAPTPSSLRGFDVLFGGNLAIGAGLSSSASICVGTAFALDALWGLGGTSRDHVDAALWGEREFVGVRCGIMDPYAVAYARPDHLLWLDCKDESTELVPLEAGLAVAVADSGIRRDLAQGAFNERVSECAEAFEGLRPFWSGATCLRDVPAKIVEDHGHVLGEAAAKRARHVSSEYQRTLAARAALQAGDPVTFGAQISASHASLRDLFEVSVPELDCLVEAALSWDGVLGSRLTGAGFGGCTVVLLRAEACPGFAEHVETIYGERFGRSPQVAFFRGDPGPREL